MSGSVYNMAHRLARAIRESDEYGSFIRARERIEKDEKNLEMLKNLREKQMKVQAARMRGEEGDEKEAEMLRKIQELVEYNQTLREYLESEQRLFTMYSDIMEIIGDAVDLDFSLPGDEGEGRGQNFS